MVEVITLSDSQRWNEVVRSMSFYDYYHLAEYHALDHSGTPLLFVFRDASCRIAYPFILRDIDGRYKDIASVYGYAGPLASDRNVSPETLEKFREALSAYFDSENVVSVFSRLHPLYEEQDALLIDFPNVVDDGKQTVALDLRLPEEEQKKQYAKRLPGQLNHLRKMGVRVERTTDLSMVDDFIDIYYQNMERVSASPGYFFPRDYFVGFLSKIDSAFFFAYLDDKPIAAVLATFANGIIQYHLSATYTAYLIYSPTKLLIDEIRRYGVENHFDFLHLGGGYGGGKDSLFQFKSLFSKKHCAFKTWRYIHNRAVYAELVSERSSDPSSESFFPLYRN